jgi:hypothetical protein
MLKAEGRRLKARKAKSELSAAVLAALFFCAACDGGDVVPSGAPRIVLNTTASIPTIDVVDVPADQLRLLKGTEAREVWQGILKVSVAPDQPAMLGEYRILPDGVQFTPMFPLDPGREYHVSFTAPGASPITGAVALPARDTTPTTVVTQVFPSVAVVPENLLRLYIHFSAPMGMKGGLDYIHLLDDAGKDVIDPFLPLDAEFFNEDRTRYTAFFDPAGRSAASPSSRAWADR